jgi:hypothetical protein
MDYVLKDGSIVLIAVSMFAATEMMTVWVKMGPESKIWTRRGTGYQE